MCDWFCHLGLINVNKCALQKVKAKSRLDGSTARLVVTGLGGAVRSLEALEQQDGPFDGIVVAAGAANGVVKEAEDMKVPLSLCQASVDSCARNLFNLLWQ